MNKHIPNMNPSVVGTWSTQAAMDYWAAEYERLATELTSASDRNVKAELRRGRNQAAARVVGYQRLMNLGI